jgi:hypothetical protein
MESHKSPTMTSGMAIMTASVVTTVQKIAIGSPLDLERERQGRDGLNASKTRFRQIDPLK